VQLRGDGTSGSSMSASSPEMFHDDHVNENDVRQNYNPRINETDVIITSQDIIKSMYHYHHISDYCTYINYISAIAIRPQV